MFSCEFCEVCKNNFFAEHHQTTIETLNYDREIKAYRLEPEVQVIKEGSQGKRTRSTRVFQEGVQNEVWCDCQQYISKFTEKVFAAMKISISVTNLSKGGNS